MRSAKLQLIYGLKMSKTAFGHFHHLNLLHVHVLHVWMVATLKGGGGQPASKVGRVTPPPPPPPPPNKTLIRDPRTIRAMHDFSSSGRNQSPDFIIYMSNNPNCCRCLLRLVVLNKGEISLHFDLPSQHNCRTRSLLLWVLIRIPVSGLSRYS